jgi:hypothetical protein
MARRIVGTGVPVGVGEDDPTWWRREVGVETRDDNMASRLFGG